MNKIKHCLLKLYLKYWWEKLKYLIWVYIYLINGCETRSKVICYLVNNDYLFKNERCTKLGEIKSRVLTPFCYYKLQAKIKIGSTLKVRPWPIFFFFIFVLFISTKVVIFNMQVGNFWYLLLFYSNVCLHKTKSKDGVVNLFIKTALKYHIDYLKSKNGDGIYDISWSVYFVMELKK